MTALHPYFKLAYIKLAWGGPAEQEAECEAGNPFAKDWQDEARKLLENMVRVASLAKESGWFLIKQQPITIVACFKLFRRLKQDLSNRPEVF